MGFTQLLSHLVSFIFPPTEDELLIAALTLTDIERMIVVRAIPHGVALLTYRDPKVRALIHRAKYARDPHAISLLGHALHTYLISIQEQAIVVPVPLSRERLSERGFNQTELIVQAALSGTPHRIDTGIVSRTRHTAPQTHLPRKERLSNLVGAFTATPTKMTDQRIIIVDDVSTTGATLLEVRKVLVTTNAQSITVVALAH